MPHYVQEGMRSLADSLCVIRTRKEYPIGAYIIEIIDIIAGVTFIAGSICFMPAYSEDVPIFLSGCFLYIVGSILYSIVCLFCLAEAIHEEGHYTFEVWENGLYLLGSIIFLMGTILYMPQDEEIAKCDEFAKRAKTWGIDIDTCASVAQEVNKYDKEFWGTWLFIVGSIVFAFAAFVNAMGQHRYDRWTHNMRQAITTLYLFGSILFAMGSVCFLPHMGCNEEMAALGAWMFIIGSLAYFLGAWMSLWRTTVIYASQEIKDEHIKLAKEPPFSPVVKEVEASI